MNTILAVSLISTSSSVLDEAFKSAGARRAFFSQLRQNATGYDYKKYKASDYVEGIKGGKIKHLGRETKIGKKKTVVGDGEVKGFKDSKGSREKLLKRLEKVKNIDPNRNRGRTFKQVPGEEYNHWRKLPVGKGYVNFTQDFQNWKGGNSSLNQKGSKVRKNIASMLRGMRKRKNIELNLTHGMDKFSDIERR